MEREVPPARLIFFVAVGILPGFAYGLVLAYSAPALVCFKNPNCTNLIQPMTEEEGSWFVSILYISQICGTLGSSMLADILGRKTTLVVSTLVSATGWMGIYAARETTTVLVGRLVCGFGTGFGTPTGYMYLSEIATTRWRGCLTILNTFVINIGMMAGLVASSAIDVQDMPLVCTLPLAAFLMLIKFIPESPIWLGKGNQEAKAFQALQRLRQDRVTAEREMKELVVVAKLQAAVRPGLRDIWMGLRQPEAYKPLLIMSINMVLLVNSGADVLSYYSVEIFAQAQLGLKPYPLAILLQVVFTIGGFGAIYLMLAMKRKTQISIFGSLFTFFILAMGISMKMTNNQTQAGGWLNVLPCVFMLMAFFCYSMGMGFVIYSWLGELFHNSSKGFCVSFVNTMRYLVSFVTLKTFPALQSTIGFDNVILVNGLIGFIMLVFNILVMPETKDLSLTELANIFKSKRNKVKTDVP